MSDDPKQPDKQASLDTVAPPDGSLSQELDSLKTLPPADGDDEEITGSWQNKKLAGRFILEEKLGEGGMGVVFRARDTALDERVAVKVLQRSYTQSADDVRRFKREIKTARRISHPNVIRIHEFGIDEGEAFICMELLTGGDLASRIESGRIPYERALDIAIEIADGVAAAHDEGIVHRDLKPHNVLFDDKDNVKLLDFGIARFTSKKTQTAGLMGTPHYMSPEQADGQPVSCESDVYSLGVVFFELFTGRLPFEGDSLAKLALSHVSVAPPKPRDVAPELSPAIEALILRALEKDPAHRYAHAGDVAAALRAVRHPSAKPEEFARRAPPNFKRAALFTFGAMILAAGVTIAAVKILQSQGILFQSQLPIETIQIEMVSPTPTATPKPTQLALTPKPTKTRPLVMATRNPTPKPTKSPVRKEDVLISPAPEAHIVIRDSKGKVIDDTGGVVPSYKNQLAPGVYQVQLTRPCASQPVRRKLVVTKGKSARLIKVPVPCTTQESGPVQSTEPPNRDQQRKF